MSGIELHFLGCPSLSWSVCRLKCGTKPELIVKLPRLCRVAARQSLKTFVEYCPGRVGPIPWPPGPPDFPLRFLIMTFREESDIPFAKLQ
jgi:hypothetical protein